MPGAAPAFNIPGAGAIPHKNAQDRGYATSLDMRVYLWRDEVEGNAPIMTVEYKLAQWYG